MYLPISHPDIYELLRSKDHIKGDPRQKIDSNIAVTITDDWIESMIDGDKEKQELFGEVLKTRMISGSPYIIFIDNANRQNPKCYVERGLSVKTSNLCFTGDTLVVVADDRKTVRIRDLVGTSFKVNSAANTPSGWAPTVNNAVAFKTGERSIVEVYMEDGSFFCCTPDHLLAKPDCSWVEAKDSIGVTLESGLMVKDVQFLPECEDVYDLTVDNDHNFYILPHPRYGGSSRPLLVHNCSEIFLHTDEHHTFVCVLSSLNLSKYDEYKDWRSPISGRTVPQIGIHLLEAVVSEFIRKAKDKVGMGRSVRFAEKSRALGLGVMGLHTLYQKRGLPFESSGARELNIVIHKWIREEAEIASRELADTFGEPEWCRGSGMRHTHLLAIAPTRTNSVISGAFSQGIEPIDRNYFVAKQAKGTYVRKNPVLEKLLCDKGVGPEVWDQILADKGSVRNLTCLTDAEKEVFKTAREINQFEIIKQAADRQPYVCQGQSVNLFVDPEADATYLMRLHLSAWKMGLKSLYYLKSSSLLTKKPNIGPTAKEEKEIKTLVITKDGCPWCVKLKEQLKEDGIPFKEIGVEEAKAQDKWSPDFKTVPQLYLWGGLLEGGYTGYMDFRRSLREESGSELVHNGYAAFENGHPVPELIHDRYGECAACEA
jgi:ribonucleotide reductase alpha subunit